MPSIETFRALSRLYYRAIAKNDPDAPYANILEREINKFAAMVNRSSLTHIQIHMLVYEHIVINFNYDRHSVWHMINQGFGSHPEGCLKLAGLEPLLFTRVLKIFDRILTVAQLDCESHCHYIADIEGEEVAAELYILLTLFGKNTNIAFMETFIRQKKRSELAGFLLAELQKRGIYNPPVRFT